MAKKINSFMQTLITIVRTLATFTLHPDSNYAQHVTTPEQMMRLSWNQTGQNLKAAIDKVGREYLFQNGNR